MLRLLGLGFIEPLIKAMPQTLGQSKCACYNLQWQQIKINPLGYDDRFRLGSHRNALL